jgi:hypothetical protein
MMHEISIDGHRAFLPAFFVSLKGWTYLSLLSKLFPVCI